MAFRFPQSIVVGESSARQDAATFQLSIGKEIAELRLELNETGNVEFFDKTGHVLPADLAKLVCTKNDSQIRKWLEEQALGINQAFENVLGFHLDTPDPDSEIVLKVRPVDTPTLTISELKPLGLLGWLFKSRRKKIEQENLAIIQQNNPGFEEQDKAWVAESKEQERLRYLVEVKRLQDVNAMIEFLGLRIGNIRWPHRINIGFEIPTLSDVFIDVEFPGINDMPIQQAVLAKRGSKLNIKELSSTQIRKNYADYTHAIGFRIIGECFHALPTLEKVMFSGCIKEHINKPLSEGCQYLYSAMVGRDNWRNIDFGRLGEIDLLRLFEQFELRRSVTKTGVFKPIKPFRVVDMVK